MKVGILGSTGFLGEQIVEVLSQEKEYELVLLSGYLNLDKLMDQVRRFQPRYAFSPFLAKETPPYSLSKKTQFMSEREALRDILLSEEVEGVFFASGGISFLSIFLELLDTPKPLWIASKEMIILAGEIKPRHFFLKRPHCIPLDSEHNAIWQMLHMIQREEIAKIYLTASGGPFYDWQGEEADITPEMALAHPNWRMGTKITIDSANLINKGLEVIEASILFGFDFTNLDVVIQRESLIHALITMKDGFTLALLSPPDMRSVIFNALHPQREHPNPFAKLDFAQLRFLRFDYPVPSRFRGFYLALNAGKKGSGYPTLFCGADEACVQAFLQRKITLDEIPSIIERVMEQEISAPHNGEDLEYIYRLGVEGAEELIRERSFFDD